MRLTAVAIFVSLAFAQAAAPGAAADDPARLVEWHLAGNVGLGMARDRVEYTYGRPSAVAIPFYTYNVAGGRLVVVYDHAAHVKWLYVSSPRYRTRDGFGVGSRIPLGPCHTVAGRCEHRWRGFTYAPGLWFKHVRWNGRATFVYLDVDRGRVTTIRMQS